MRQVGADTTAILAFLESLRHGGTVDAALRSPGVPPASREFVLATRAILHGRGPHRLAAVGAAFAFGREGAIPDMFHQGVAHLAATQGAARGP